ncbi:hypothetical protein NONI108955_01475 [Nocardia ninae]|uniref:Uncharacterized protein n=1 Tax=Nocardia ninae NBRC 108245 TaxID=1210091 RepID=A0A511MCQ4_9NOCA|nr:hypothetical protein [Nocardia ninae]GEM38251.1 hypothetical protein NN4_27700 [Nocardia ninae NBRC 108245]
MAASVSASAALAAIEPEDDGSDAGLLEAAYYQMVATHLCASLVYELVASI